MEIPDYTMNQVSGSPTSYNETCGYKLLFSRILKLLPWIYTDWSLRDAGTFCHAIFEFFHKSKALKLLMRDLATLSYAQFEQSLEKIMDAFVAIIGPIIDEQIVEMQNLRKGKLSFNLYDQFVKVKNFLKLEMRRLIELVEIAGVEKACLDYYLPIHTETKFRSSGRLYYDENGNRHSEFDPDDPIKFSCVVDFIRRIPGELVGDPSGRDQYVLGDYKTGKNRIGYNDQGDLIYDDGSEYGHKAELQCIYPLVISANLPRDHPLRQIQKCKYYEVFNPTPGPPLYQFGKNKGKQKAMPNWQPGLKAIYPDGARAGPHQITRGLKLEAKGMIRLYYQKWKRREFEPKMSEFACSRWCQDYYDTCKDYWEDYKNAEFE